MLLAFKCFIALLVLSAFDLQLYRAPRAKSFGVLLSLTSRQLTKIRWNTSKISTASWDWVMRVALSLCVFMLCFLRSLFNQKDYLRYMFVFYALYLLCICKVIRVTSGTSGHSFPYQEPWKYCRILLHRAHLFLLADVMLCRPQWAGML